MAQVKVQWNLRVAGKSKGQIETVEETAFIKACAKKGRLRVLERPQAAPKPVPAPKAEDVAKHAEPSAESLLAAKSDAGNVQE